jgi:hypothetical protein
VDYAVFFAMGMATWAGIAWQVRQYRRRRRSREVAVNVLGPDDPRWKGSPSRRSLGGIEVTDGKNLQLFGRLVSVSSQSYRYCRAVREAARREKLQRLVRRVDAVALHDGEDPGKD